MSAGPSFCPGRPGRLSNRRECHPVPGGFHPYVVLQHGEKVSHCGQTEADISVDGESGKSCALCSNVKSFFKLSNEIIMVFPFIVFFSVLVLQSFHLLQHTEV